LDRRQRRRSRVLRALGECASLIWPHLEG
jgi:hypothetical protein